jgi:hypothetical protein
MGFRALIFKGQYTLSSGLLDVIDVWTRYVLAIPSPCSPVRD